jgi:acetyl esterase/lipase
MLKSSFSIIAIMLLTLAASASTASTPSPDESIIYKQVDEISLTLHIFRPPLQAETAVPAIVFFHGGGFNNGSPSQFYRQAAHLAQQGLVAISVKYRLKNTHGTDPRACVRDAKSAMRWVRENAVRLGIDPRRIAAGGGSAGGHLAAATALLENFNEATDNLPTDCRPNALILFNPVMNNGPDGYAYNRVEAYWENFSPAHNIRKGAPPALIMLGSEDPLFTVEQAKACKAAYDAVGSRCDLHVYEGQKHGFFNRGEMFTETLSQMDAFLRSLGYLNAAL